MHSRKDLAASTAETLRVLEEQGRDLDKQEKVIAAMKEAGDDVTDVEEMTSLLRKMHAIARRRVESSTDKIK